MDKRNLWKLGKRSDVSSQCRPSLFLQQAIKMVMGFEIADVMLLVYTKLHSALIIAKSFPCVNRRSPVQMPLA